MQKKYRIEIGHNQSYPFGQINQLFPNYHYEVRILIPIEASFSHKHYQRQFRKIAEVQLLNSSIIKLNGIIQKRKENQYVLIYQQIPYGLESIVDLKIQIGKIQTRMINLCQFLLQKNILPIYDINKFGIGQNQQLKYLLLPNFTQIQQQTKLKSQFQKISGNIKNLIKQLKLNFPISPRQTIEDDKTSQKASQRDLSAYNKKFQEKISQIQNKLLLNRFTSTDKLNSSQKLKRRKKLSQNLTDESVSKSSSQQKPKKVNQNKVKTYMQKNRLSYKNEREEQYSKTMGPQYYKTSKQYSKESSSQEQISHENDENNKVMKSSKLTNSLIIEQKNEEMQKLKHHKSSFGDYSINQSQKQMKLKRRISFALQKSQYALNLYQKYQSKRNSNKNSQNFNNNKFQ